MKKQTYKNIGGVIIILLVLLSIISCGGAEKSVRNGRLQLDESITLGDAFDNYQYFTSTEWESFKDSQGRDIVQVTGKIDMSSMFISESVNMLEGRAFEEGLLSLLLNQAGKYQNEGIDIISGGDVGPVIDRVMDTDKAILRDDPISHTILEYDNSPEEVSRYMSGLYQTYMDTQNPGEMIKLADDYILNKYGDLENFYRRQCEKEFSEAFSTSNSRMVAWVNDAVQNYIIWKTEGGETNYRAFFDQVETATYDYYGGDKSEAPERLTSFIKAYLYGQSRITEQFIPVLKLFYEGKDEEALAMHESLIGYMGTNLAGNKGTYTCQFAVEGKDFRFYAGELALTLDIKGADSPITFTLPESENYLPYIVAVYSNKRIIE